VAPTMLFFAVVSALVPAALGQVPTVSVTSLSFADKDLDANELGGPVTWQPPGSTATVTHYDVYVATDSAGTARSAVSLNVPVGTNSATVADNTALGSYSHLLVYTANGNGQQAAPSSVAFSDSDASVSSLAFEDLDLDNVAIGGDVTWSPPGDVSQTSHYVVYLSTDTAGTSRSQVGTATVGSNTFAIPVDTLRFPYTQIHVHTASSSAEQSTPTTLVFTDNFALVTSIQFQDQDLDQTELGGYLSWSVSGATNLIYGYEVYVDMVNNGLFRSKLGSVPVGTEEFVVGPDFQPSPFIFFLVYTCSSLAESSGAASVGIFDIQASASAVSFADLDLDPNELGGTLTWTEPADTSQVVFYDVYIALNTAGENRTLVGNPVPVLTAQTDFPVDTQRDASLFILVYARSSFVEQSTPATQAISDEARLVPTIGFTDYDLDQAELGGSIVWTPPNDVTLVTHYATYLTDDLGNRSQVGSDVAIGATTEFDLPADFAQESWTKVQVYLRSTLAEQTTPQSLAISDTVAEIADINFTDEDLDISEIGGVVSWLEPAVASEIQDYVLYLGQGGSGASRSSLGLSANSTASLTQVEALLPHNTALPLAFDRLLLYARSTLAEQSTPASQGISDALVAMDVNFTDQDLDEGEIGGTLSWELIAGSTALVTKFIAYLADSQAGDNVRTVLGTATPTSRSLALAPELSAQSFAHLLVYARSSLFEQTTPAATALLDVNASVSGTSFTDFDLDADQLGGDITWTVPRSLDEVVSYAVYLAGPVAENRSQLNGLLSPSTSLLAIPPDTERQTYTTLAVYTSSVLVEQSTPDLAVLDDSQSTVQDLRFQDEDFDAGELAGNVTWTAPVDDRYVSSYQVYFANFSDGRERSEIGAPLPTALTSREILQDTALESFQFALVYTASSLAEQTTPAATAISDTSSAVEGLQFTDLDLDFEELGGEVSWTLPLLPVSVDVLLYLALNRAGSGRFLVGQVPGDVVNFTLPADTPKGSFNYLVVYTRSVSSEQTTPSSLQIIDTGSTAENISFIDKDLEAGEIGGTVSWAEPTETSQVQDYLLYLGLNDTRQRSSLGLTVAAASPATVLQADVLEDTSLATFDQIWVYARSTFAEQTTPAFQVVSDASTVLTVNFTDEDLDEGELGGKISFDVVSGDTSQVVTFSAYGADSEDGRGYRFALGTVQLGTWSLDLSPEVSVQNFSHLLLYARSSLFEQTTPAIIELTDVNASVSGTSFADLDLDAEELGGRVSWTLPYNLAQVVYYNVYVTDALGTNRSQIDGPLLATADSIVMPPNTPRQQYTSLAVFTQSALVEQTTPDAVEVEDVSSSVEELAFVDEDLDTDELGGNASWAPANDSRYVTGYKVYLANSSQGEGRQEIGFLESATDTGLEVPDNTALEGFRALLVYTTSSLAEQTTPVAQSLSDVSVTIRNVSFVDFDLDRQELGGEILWGLPTSTVQTDVSVYLAMSPSGSGRSLVAHVPGSTDTMALAADTPKGAFHFVAVYARSPFAEQTTPSVLRITDTDSSVGNLSFVDKDLDLDELGGIVSWDESADTAQVQDYLVFLASNASGDDRSAVGSPLPSTGPFLTLEAQLPPNTGLMAFKHVAVYARSALAEQSTPVSEELSDAFLAMAVNFTDQDLDEGDIGGTLAFDLASGDISQLQHFVIYLADAKVPPFRRFHLGDAMPGATSLTVAPELPAENFTHFLVYGQSSLFEQTTPSVVELVDNNASVSGTAFTDLDLDGYQIGGRVSWSLPENLNEVAHYNVYLSDGLGINRSQINGALAFTATSVEIAADTGKHDYSRLVVYTASALVEQTTPDSTELVDTESRIEDLTFLDEDLDLEEVGGNASWNPANDSRYVLGYQVYLANLSDGSRGRQAVGGFLPVELTSILVPENLPLQSFQYLLVYTRSSLAEQTTPAAQGFNDTFAPVSQLQFVDKDLDGSEVGGQVSWEPPEDLARVVLYAVYLAATATGTGRSLVGTAPAPAVATPVLDIPLDTILGAFTHVLTYSQSIAFEQSTPAALFFNDSSLLVRDLSFLDQDLDDWEIGGKVSWTPPEDPGVLEGYVLYLAVSATGGSRSLLGNVTVGANSLDISADFPLGNYTHVLVYTRSDFGESSIPEAVPIVDVFSRVTDLDFVDKDLDAEQLGGFVRWIAPADVSQVVDYVLYLSDEGIGEERSQAGNPVPVGANETLLAEDTNLTNFTYLQVYARSALAEQTTPTQFLISDAASTVQGLHFIDKDLDAGELGGIVTWQTPVDTSQLVHYRVFLLDNTGNRSQIGGDLPPNVQTATVAADQPLAGSTAAAVFAKSSLFEQTTPASVEISDIESVATDLQFEDVDLDTDQFGGVLNFSEPADATQVAAYSLYFAAADLSGRQAVHSDVPSTAELTATTSENIDRAHFEVFLVYTKSTFVEQSTPAAAVLNDTQAAVSNISFVDKDLDVGELGGTVTWASEGDDFAVQDYLVYVVQNAGRSLVGTSPVGSNRLAIDQNFSLPPTQEIHIYSRSRFFESTTPQVHNISDTDASVSNVQFLDEDLDKFELAGPVVWTEPADAAQVTHYRVYFATSAVGTGRSQLGQDVPAGTNTAYVPDNFQSLSVSHILLYTRSSLAEQTTPVALEFIDDAIEVENITFTDEDLDPSELGGQVAWEPPNFTATVTHFIVYLTTDVLGTNRTKVGSEIPLGTNVALVPAETLLRDWKYIAVYMKSPGAEQTTPNSLEISDTALLASGVSLIDLDLDPLELGGTITWSPPDETLITGYDVYLSPGPITDHLGAFVNTSAAGTTQVFLSTDTPLLNFSYVLVYARSALAEQTTPAATMLNDSTLGLDFEFEDFFSITRAGT